MKCLILASAGRSCSRIGRSDGVRRRLLTNRFLLLHRLVVIIEATFESSVRLEPPMAHQVASCGFDLRQRGSSISEAGQRSLRCACAIPFLTRTSEVSDQRLGRPRFLTMAGRLAVVKPPRVKTLFLTSAGLQAQKRRPFSANSRQRHPGDLR